VDHVVIPRAEAQVDQVEEVWTRLAATLRPAVGEGEWRSGLGQVAPRHADGRVLVLEAPSAFVANRVRDRYQDLLVHHLEEIGWTEPLIDVVVTRSDRVAKLFDAAELEQEGEPPAPQTSRRSREARSDSSPLDPRYTFDAFVIGSSNRFAHAAALSVAETPAKSYNPLFIYGAAGLGKTHLLQAIGNYALENFPSLHVRYVTTETFMNEFVDAIRNNTQSAFKRRYRACDILLVDDVQFLEHKESLQEEFFHTFNALHADRRQIVLTSDRPPKALATLEERLRSRFLSGLLTDVQPPELETRLAILRKKAEIERVELPQDVLGLIATHVTDNIRELEGALIRVFAFANLNRRQLDLETAKAVLADIVSRSEPSPITPRAILDATAAAFGFSVEDLCGTSRRRPLVTARQVGMYVFREVTDLSYPAIAREFGGRDHTTVIHAVDKISRLMRENRTIFEQVNDLIRSIKTR
jgi:chromosomal replication initiator protein